MRFPEAIEQIAAVTSSPRKAATYGEVFSPIPVAQVWPLFDEKKLAIDAPNSENRAAILSLWKAQEDLSKADVNIGSIAPAMMWWARHTMADASVQHTNGKTLAIFHDVHNFLPQKGQVYERPESEAEWFAQMRASANTDVWLIAGHTMMEVGGTFPMEAGGIITRGHTTYTEDDILRLRGQLGKEQDLLAKVGAGSLSLARNPTLFDRTHPLTVWFYDNINDMNSGKQIAEVPWDNRLDKNELWRVANGIWPQVIDTLNNRLEVRRNTLY